MVKINQNYMKKVKKIFRIIKENGVLSIPILTRKAINFLYSFLFFENNIKTDYSSFIIGLKYMEIGKVKIGRYCRIEIITRYNDRIYKPKLIIGNNVELNDMVHIGCANYIKIGDNCLFASRIYISDHNHGRYKGEKISDLCQNVIDRDLDTSKSVIIGNNVWLCEGVTVLPGSSVGNNAIIGANSVVIGHIPANTIAVGAPAKVIKCL